MTPRPNPTPVHEVDGIRVVPICITEYEARDSLAMEAEMVRLVSVAHPFAVLSRRTSWRPEGRRLPA